MGRKIPAKKHRGVKDPAKQHAQRFQSIKDKINAPPTDPDEQPVPRSLLRLFAFQQPRAPAKPIKKKPKRPHEGVAGGGAVAALRRLPGEGGRAFSLRINSAVRALSHPHDHDYPLDLEETDTRGEYIASQRSRRQRKHRAALAVEERRAGGKGVDASLGRGASEGGERLSKAQRRALKKKEQLKAKEEEVSCWAGVTGGGGGGGGVTGGSGGGGGGDALQRERRERARLDAVEAYRALKKQRARAQAAKGTLS
ncbi:hypothetical protein MSG28_004403 [Choristoneura fumiferana]|uniref:Uncharacterized protein n=1 Tax=Choristoneura fumiferana TaxID=7141 RepID=A0ACC0KJT3_CHOFU|nr:hypothetical protein MSG28_004403 [Choristoneura fumiferana]